MKTAVGVALVSVLLAACSSGAAGPSSAPMVTATPPPPPPQHLFEAETAAVVPSPDAHEGDICSPQLGPQDDTAERRAELSECHERSGRLVDALRDSQQGLMRAIQARDVARMKALRERTRSLLARVAHVTFVTDGPPPEYLQVLFDGRAVPVDALTKRFSVDAGEHRVVATGRRNGRAVKQDELVTITEGDSLTIRLEVR